MEAIGIGVEWIVRAIGRFLAWLFGNAHDNWMLAFGFSWMMWGCAINAPLPHPWWTIAVPLWSGMICSTMCSKHAKVTR